MYFKEATAKHLHFIEKGVRGGVSTMPGNRNMKCSNNLTNPAFDNLKPITDAEAKHLVNIMIVRKEIIPEDTFNENYMFYHDAISLYVNGTVPTYRSNDVRRRSNVHPNY